jgi:hypothetical protein
LLDFGRGRIDVEVIIGFFVPELVWAAARELNT